MPYFFAGAFFAAGFLAGSALAAGAALVAKPSLQRRRADNKSTRWASREWSTGKNKKVKRGRVSFIEETKRLSEVSC